MSETHPVAGQDNGRIIAIVCYVLFLVGWPTLHFATIVGVILAYIQRNDYRGTVWESHFDAMISTFWVAVVAGIVAVLACITIVGLIVGIPLIIGLIVWFLYRVIRGLVHAIDVKAY